MLGVVLVLATSMGAGGQSCCAPTVNGISRPAGGEDGSSQWAVALARPALAACSADTEVRVILGARVGINGRLFRNVGSWSVVGWSPSLQQICQVNVAFDGVTTTSTRAQAAPGPGVQRPMPDSVNSTAIFADVAVRAPVTPEATLVLFNQTAYLGHPSEAAWGINLQQQSYWYSASGEFLGN